MKDQLPAAWLSAVLPHVPHATWDALDRFVQAERAAHRVFPPAPMVFNALRLTPLSEVRVVLLGQDPYHDEGQAHGLCFSVPMGIKPPPSLRNILKELAQDLDLPLPPHGDLTAWAKQGVLMLNSVLTVRAHQANSHQGQGWEAVTAGILRAVAARSKPCVFVVWGAAAQKVTAWVASPPHVLISTVHPSPLSAYKGFLGSRPFSKVNAALAALGQPPVDWRLPDAAERRS